MTIRLRTTSAFLAVALVAAAGGTALADHSPDPRGSGPADRPVDAACDRFWPNTSSSVTLENVVVPTEGGESVHGCLAFPTEGTVDTLVVMVHGLGHTVQNAWSHHLVEAAEHGAAAISVNFRDNFGFPSLRGAEDTIHATQMALARFPGVTNTILVGTSMGGNISGTAIHEAPRLNGGEGLYDWWVDIEGLTNLAESYVEARAALPAVAAGMERDAGGSPAQVPAEYARRSPVLNADKMAATGLRGVVATHGPVDGLVPYWQAVSMVQELRRNGVPTRFITTTRGSGHWDDTTAFGYAGLQATNNSTVDLAGHGWEGDRSHPVVAAGMEQVLSLIGGETLVDSDIYL